jgi:hypothetical protein
MDHEQTLSSTRVAVLGWFLLLLGLLAVSAFLLLTASPAGAQSDEGSSGSEQASSESGQAQEPAPAEPAEGDRAAAPPEGTREPETAPSDSIVVHVSAPAPLDAIVEPVLPPVEVALPLSLPPVVPELPPAPVNVQVAPTQRARPAPVASAPDVNAVPPAPEPPAPSVVVESPTPPPVRSWFASPSRATTEFRSGSPPEGDTRAPPGVPPAATAPGSSFSSSSAGRDFGQSLLLFGIVAAGMLFALTRGRRLLIEALGWLPARWSLLIERPG